MRSRAGVWKHLLLTGAAFAGLCLSAQVRVVVPGTPVPMTLQSLAVLLIGLTLPPWAALASTFAYVALGASGLPVFASATGVLGLTGGYLAGFVLAAPLVSALRGRRAAGNLRLLAVSFAGLLVILASGVFWQWLMFGRSLGVAIGGGLLPFAGKSVIEAFLAVGMVRAVRFAGESRPASGH